jgi:hypothetical protein
MKKNNIIHEKNMDISQEEAIKLGKKEREELGYCVCGKRGKAVKAGSKSFILCDDCKDNFLKEKRK